MCKSVHLGVLAYTIILMVSLHTLTWLYHFGTEPRSLVISPEKRLVVLTPLVVPRPEKMDMLQIHRGVLVQDSIDLEEIDNLSSESQNDYYLDVINIHKCDDEPMENPRYIFSWLGYRSPTFLLECVTSIKNEDEQHYDREICDTGKTSFRMPILPLKSNNTLVADWHNVYYSQTCSGLFGNGFTIIRTIVAPPLRSVRAGVRCGFNHLGAMICSLSNIIVNIDKLVVNGDLAGRDPVEAKSLFHPDEKEEIPQFQKGFLTFESSHEHSTSLHSLPIDWKSDTEWNIRLLRSLNAIPVSYDDDEYFPTVDYALFVSRTEYANPCFVVMDWYSAYSTIRIMGLDPKEVDILCLDAHPKAWGLDYVWEKLFRSFHYVAHLYEYDSTIFIRNAIIPPSSRQSALQSGVLKGQKVADCAGNRFVSDFVNYVRDSFQLSTTIRVPKNNTLTLLFRQDYFPHARSSGTIDRVVINEKEVETYIQDQFPEYNVRVAHFETLSFEEQLRIAWNSHILVAIHGAGNTLSMFQSPGSFFIELFPSKFVNRKKYLAYSCWSGIGYRHVILSRNEEIQHPTVRKFVQLRIDTKRLAKIISEI